MRNSLAEPLSSAMATRLRPIQPVSTVALFRPLHRELIPLLRSLDPAAWALPTSAGDWTVRHVAAHLLHGDLRKLSGLSESGVDDGQSVRSGDIDFAALVGRIDADNARGAEFLSTLSPRVITDLLEVTGRQIARRFADLAPEAPARTSVAWAGETVSANWTDIGREFTERFHHQAQIRDAVAAPPLADRRFIAAMLRLSVLALRRSLRAADAAAGASVVLRVTGDWSHRWTAVREDSGWALFDGAVAKPTAEVAMDADAAWRTFFGFYRPDEVRAHARVDGDATLAWHVLRARAVMIRSAIDSG